MRMNPSHILVCLIRRTLLFALLLFSSSVTAGAQTTFATITGTVTDSTGAIVEGAAVTATNVETGVSTKAATNNEGVYTVPQLREGPYTLTIAAKGFREFIATDIVLVTRDVRRIDAQLSLGNLDQSVQVSGGSTPVELETPRISDIRTAAELRTLPLNDPGIWSYLAISPMLAIRGGTYSFAGSKFNQSQFSIDGTSMSDGIGETPIGPLANYTESFQEMKIDLANNSAEFPSLGQVTIASKSGTNRFKGVVFDYYQSPMFRARNPFTGTRGSGVLHFPGLATGGPLVLPKVYDGRNRTFWFVSGETVDGSSQTAILNPTVPIEPWRRGDFSALGIPIRNPLTGETYADGRIPAAALNPVSLRIQQRFYPLPNTGNTSVLQANNYSGTVDTERSKPYYATGRIDHSFGDADRIFARFTMHQSTNPVWEGNLPAFGMRRQLRQNKAITVSWTRLIGSSLVNEFRAGHNYNNNPLAGPLSGREVVQSLGLVGLAPDLPDVSGVLKASFPTVGITGLSQIDWRNPGFLNRTNQVQDQATWLKGTHSIKVGVEIRKTDFEEIAASANLFGNVTFNGSYTGHPYADFLLGIPNTVARAFPPVPTIKSRRVYDSFAQDDWKVTRDLTLNLGMRYDVHPGWLAENDRLAMFDISSGKIVVPDGGVSQISPLMPRSYVDIVTASSVGLPRTLVKTDRNNIAPRLGFAYRPFGGVNTVIRGGYGLFFDMMPIELDASRTPFVFSETPFTNPSSPTVVFPQVFPAGGTSGPATVGLPLAVNPNLQLPYSHQYNVTLEHSLSNTAFRVSYVATLGRQMWYTRDANAPQPDNRLYIEKPRPFPQFPDISYTDNGASHDYHGLTVETERRMKDGLFWQVTYTIARDLGNTQEWSDRIENPFDLDRERGNDSAVPRHRVTTALMYDLPVGHGRKWASNVPWLLDLAVGGWQISTVGYLQSGVYLTPTISMPDPTGTRFTSTGNRPTVTIRPDQLSDPELSDPTIAQWYDVNAYGAPAIGGFGTAARGSVEGPGLNLWHFGMHKRFRLTNAADSPTLRIELTSTNIFNQPQYANPNMTVTATNVNRGRISAIGGPSGSIQQAGMRAMRLGFRLEW